MDIDSILKGHGIGGGGSNIKSIQSGQGTFNTELTRDITISGIDMSKSIVIINSASFSSPPASYNSDMDVKAKLLNATTINLERFTNTKPVDYSWTVIEFNNVKSLQRGDLTLQGASYVSINPVNLSKSILLCSIACNSGYRIAYQFVSNIQIIVRRFTYVGLYDTVHWQVIEFN